MLKGTAAVVLLCVLLGLPAVADSRIGAAPHTLTLTAGEVFSIGGTTMSCTVLRSAASLDCQAAASATDPGEGELYVTLTNSGSIVVANQTLGGLRVLYTRGGAHPGTAPRSNRRVTAIAGEALQLAGSTIGCTVSKTALRCASATATGAVPKPKSYGFTLRSDASVTAFQFGRPNLRLFSGKAENVHAHQQFTMNLGDSFGFPQTNELCTYAVVQNAKTMVCLIAQSNGPIQGTYGVGLQVGGGVFVVRIGANNTNTTVYTHDLSTPSTPPPASPLTTPQVLAPQPGDWIGTSDGPIGCHADRFFNDQEKQVDDVVCGINYRQGKLPPVGSQLVFLDHQGVAEILTYTKAKAFAVVKQFSP